MTVHGEADKGIVAGTEVVARNRSDAFLVVLWDFIGYVIVISPHLLNSDSDVTSNHQVA
jgi:hypothetical protein